MYAQQITDPSRSQRDNTQYQYPSTIFIRILQSALHRGDQKSRRHESHDRKPLIFRGKSKDERTFEPMNCEVIWRD